MSSLPKPREIVSSLISSIRTPSQPSTLDQSANPLRNAPQHIQKSLLTLHVVFPNELLPALDVLDRGLVTRLKVQDEAQGPPDPRALPGPLPRERVLRRQEDDLRHLRNVPDVQAVRHLQRHGEVQMDEAEAEPASALHQSSYDPRLQGLDGQDQALHHERPDAGLSAVTTHTRHAKVYVVRSGQLPSRLRMVNHTTSYEVRLDAWSCSCPAFAFSAFPATASENDRTYNNGPQRAYNPSRPEWTFGGLTLGSDTPVCKHLLACALVEHNRIFASFVEEHHVTIEELAGWAAGWGD